MLWSLKPKPDLEKMEEDILARGEDPALFPILNSKPELFSELLWIWEAYSVLTQSRQLGMSSPQPIAIGEILAYAEFVDLRDTTEREELLHHVQFLDQVFLADFSARNTNKTPLPSSATGVMR